MPRKPLDAPHAPAKVHGIATTREVRAQEAAQGDAARQAPTAGRSHCADCRAAAVFADPRCGSAVFGISRAAKGVRRTPLLSAGQGIVTRRAETAVRPQWPKAIEPGRRMRRWPHLRHGLHHHLMDQSMPTRSTARYPAPYRHKLRRSRVSASREASAAR